MKDKIRRFAVSIREIFGHNKYSSSRGRTVDAEDAEQVYKLLMGMKRPSEKYGRRGKEMDFGRKG